jgi:hypothetical protein
MKRQLIQLGEKSEDGEDLDNIAPFWGDAEVAKRLMKDFLTRSPNGSRDDFELILLANGFLRVVVKSDEAEINAAVTANNIADIYWPPLN